MFCKIHVGTGDGSAIIDYVLGACIRILKSQITSYLNRQLNHKGGHYGCFGSFSCIFLVYFIMYYIAQTGPEFMAFLLLQTLEIVMLIHQSLDPLVLSELANLKLLTSRYCIAQSEPPNVIVSLIGLLASSILYPQT